MLNIGYLIREVSSAKVEDKKTPAFEGGRGGRKDAGVLKGNFPDISVS